MKDALLSVFLTQADSALALLADPTSSKKERRRELEDLMGAAELTGNDNLEKHVAALARRLAAGDGLEELSGLVATLRPALISSSSDEASEWDPAHQLSERSDGSFDTSTTRVHKQPTRLSSQFDTSEHLTLLTVFQEEAREGLDRITSLLLANDQNKPDDIVTAELMRLTHGLKGAAGTLDLPIVAALTHDFEGAFETIRKGSLRWNSTLRDQLVDIADRLRLIIFDGAQPYESLDDVEHVKALLDALGNNTQLPEPGLLTVTDGSSAATNYAERRRPERRGAHTPVLRVDPARIDRLMNSVGELVFDRTRIEKRLSELSGELSGIRAALDEVAAQRASWSERGIAVRSEHLAATLSDLETKLGESLPQIDGVLQRLKSDTALLRRTEFALQDGLTSVRMQSVRSIFQRLTPQLRAIARQADKHVSLATAGGDTEFDKTVADQMVDPLIQLLRNAVAHGIETPELREKRGKSRVGRITVTARHESNVVVLEVSDDGSGVDVAALRKLFVERGEWSEAKAAQASDQRVLERLFDAGYSSRDTTDQLAGRGVGLSSVRETVTKLGGEVLVSSVSERGTTFTMRLPLTTAIASALLFKIGGHVFAIPNVHVIEHGSIPLPLITSPYQADDQSLPLVPLHELLGFPLPTGEQDCAIVVIEYLGKRLAFSCDRIIGPREIVVKNLGPILAGIPLYAGATISPSGKVQLILDPAALVNIASPQEKHPKPPSTPVASSKRPKSSAATSASNERSEPLAKRVLVVDDSKAIREAMRHMLLRAGYQVMTASDGLSAWQCIIEGGCEVLVTDLEMPGESGFELLARLRADQRFATLPAVVISSKANEKNRQEASDLGASDFLPKPVSQAQLVDALRAAQRRH